MDQLTLSLLVCLHVSLTPTILNVSLAQWSTEERAGNKEGTMVLAAKVFLGELETCAQLQEARNAHASG